MNTRNWNETMREIKRQRNTLESIKDMERADIVDRIHTLEDDLETLESALRSIVSAAPANGEDCAYVTAKTALEKVFI